MSTYYCTARTNYFKVTDEERYAELFANLVASDGDEVEDFTKEENGVILHGFGAMSSIDYRVSDGDNPEYDFDVFLDEIQKILPDDEAFIYMETGHEKLCYLTGYAIVVTSKEKKSKGIKDWALVTAKELLGNPDFETQMEY